jgi:predicted alpha-1,2-mannosidase
MRWLACILLLGCDPTPPVVDPEWPADSVARLVNPFIGTAGDGNTFPGATVPWGMTAPSPHTHLPLPLDFAEGGLAAAGYRFGDPSVHGFGLTHLSGVGCPDLGAPVVAVTSGPLATDFDSYGLRRGDERAWPGYYAVDLSDGEIRAETTASERTAALRFFARRGPLNLLIDTARPVSWAGGSGRVRIVSPAEIEGESQTGLFCAQGNRQRVYFVARFDAASNSAGTWKDDVVSDAQEAQGAVGAWLRFPAGTVEVSIGVSYTSIDGARANLIEHRAFDDTRRAAQSKWEAMLGRVRVEGGTADERTIFYTALYHALVHPSIFSDADQPLRYHVFSLWDTYRTLHPLLTLLYPERQREMLRTMLELTVEKSAPPKWELAGYEVQMMVGDPADIVIADSALKGVLPDDSLVRSAWPILQTAALTGTHRPANDSYRALGYVPIDDANRAWGPVSTTLEYALADHALTRLAAVLGTTIDPALAKQADAWKNLIDPETRLFRPRRTDGSFLQPFDPDQLEGSAPQRHAGGPGYVEGTAWHYAFFAPHAVVAHADATGGAAAYVARLQSLFSTDRFVAWNEPDLAFPYHFSHFAGEGWRTAPLVAAARSRFFTNTPAGLPGNDDCGTLSAWYVFSALGFYPDVPVADDYAIGTPLFERASFGGYTIESPHASPAHIHVRTGPQRIKHADIRPGATLRLDLQP